MLVYRALLFFIAITISWCCTQRNFPKRDPLVKIDSENAFIFEGVIDNILTDSCKSIAFPDSLDEVQRSLFYILNSENCPASVFEVAPMKGVIYSNDDDKRDIRFKFSLYKLGSDCEYVGYRSITGEFIGKKVLFITTKRPNILDSTETSYTIHYSHYQSSGAWLTIKDNTHDFTNNQTLQYSLDLIAIDLEDNVRNKTGMILDLLKYEELFFNEQWGYLDFELVVDTNLPDISNRRRSRILNKHPLREDYTHHATDIYAE